MVSAFKPREWLEQMPPEKKQKVVIALVVTGFVAIVTIGVLLNEPPKTAAGQKEVTAEDMGNVLIREDPRELGLSDVSSQVADLQQQIAELKRQQENGTGARSTPDDPDAQLRSLSSEVAGTQDDLSAPPGTAYNPDRPPMRPILEPDQSITRPQPESPAGRTAPPPPPPSAPQIQTVTQGSAATSSGTASTPAAVPPVYLPTGSMITGTLINGLDAPTGRAAQNAPVPVLVRIKKEAILPSRYRSDVREAFVLASGYGDLSSERAYLRAERLSMILRNGAVIDIPIEMSAVGSDAKTGLRGRVVSKQGAIIAKALLAGTADGISRAFSNTYSLGGSGDTPSGSEIGMAGLSGGASSGLDRVAAYFLSQAEAMYPIIEVDGGRQVTFVLLKGVELTTRVAEAPKASAQAKPSS